MGRTCVSRPRLTKGVLIGALLAVAAVWIRAYALILPVGVAVWAYASTDTFARLAQWVESHTPVSRALLSWGLALTFGTATVAYVLTFVMSLAWCTMPGEGRRLCVVNKMKYGVARNEGDAGEYYRTHKLGRIGRGDYALARTPDGNLLQKVVARPGDTVTVADGALFVNGRMADHGERVTATYRPLPHTPYSIMRQMRQAEKEAQKTHSAAEADTAALLLPTVKREEKWRPYTYAVLHRNEDDERCYPWNVAYQWNAYQWGPMRMPHKGDTMALTYANVTLYGPLVERHERRRLEPTPGVSYTFKMDYYMTVGDDRDNLCDSRAYGPLPESCIISNIIVLRP